MGGQDLLAVAIDGPVASGKTMVGRLVAERMGYRFLDTGMMYRALTWAAIERGMSLEDEDALERLARNLTMRLAPDVDGDRLTVDGEDVTGHLRDPRLEPGVSRVAKVSGVRRELVKAQREIAAEGSIVMAGRDIGTIVLPGAPLKVFLTAPVDVRARRRYDELQEQGKPRPYDRVLDDLRQRDKIDSERADSPLRAAEDALVIDTEDTTVQQTADTITDVLESG